MEEERPDDDEALYAKQDEEWRAFINNLCAQLDADFAEKIENLEKMYQDIDFARLFHDILFLSQELHGEKHGIWTEAQAMARLEPDSNKWTVEMFRSIGFQNQEGSLGGEDSQPARCFFLQDVVLGNDPKRPNLYEDNEDVGENLTPKAVQVLPPTINIMRQTLDKARAAVQAFVRKISTTPVKSNAEGNMDKGIEELRTDHKYMRIELDAELEKANEDLTSLIAFHNWVQEDNLIFNPNSGEYSPNVLVPAVFAASIQPNSNGWRFELLEMVMRGNDPTIQTWPVINFYNMRSPGYEGCIIGYDESKSAVRRRLCEQSYRLDNGEEDSDEEDSDEEDNDEEENNEEDNTPGDDADMESSDEELFPDAVTPVEELFPEAVTPVTPVTPPAPLLNDDEIEKKWGFLNVFL